MNDHTEETELFKNINECNGGNILECNSFKRIKIILNKYSQTSKTAQDAHDLINNELGDAKYSNLKLLDDFYHLINDKHNENALRDENNNEYDKVYKALTNGNECNLVQCDIIKAHYDYKRQLQGNIASNIHNKNGIRTISRIHTYFLHGYDINRLRPKEREQIQQEINDDDLLSDDDIDSKRMNIIYSIMQQKQQKLDQRVGASKGYNKFVDQPLDDDAVDIDTDDDGKDNGDDYDNYVDIVDGDDINQYDEYYDTDYSNNELPDNKLFDILSDEEKYTSVPSAYETISEIQQRAGWCEQSECEIYSKTSNNWLQALIIQIYDNYEGEWLKVQYIEDGTVQIQHFGRYNRNIRAISIYQQQFDEQSMSINIADCYVEESKSSLIRKNWVVGSKCVIREKQGGKWMKGAIIKIYDAWDGEWLTVQYCGNKTIQIGRFSRNIDVIGIGRI